MKKARRLYNSVTEIVDFDFCPNFWVWRHFYGKGKSLYTPEIELDTLAHNLFSQSVRIDKQLIHDKFNDTIHYLDFQEAYEKNIKMPYPKLLSFDLQNSFKEMFIDKFSIFNQARYVSALQDDSLYSVEGIFLDSIILDGREERYKGLNKKLVGVPDKIEFWGKKEKYAVPIDLKVNEKNMQKVMLQLVLYNLLCEEELKIESKEGVLFNLFFEENNLRNSKIKVKRFQKNALLEEKAKTIHYELLDLKKSSPGFLNIYGKDDCSSCLINDFCNPTSIYSLKKRGRFVLTRNPKGGFREIGRIKTVGIEALLSESAVIKDKKYNFESIKFFIPPLSELASKVMNAEEYKHFMSFFEYNLRFSNDSSLLRFYLLTDNLRYKPFKTMNYLTCFMHASRNSIDLHLMVAEKAGFLETIEARLPNKKEVFAYRIKREDGKMPDEFKDFRKNFRKHLRSLGMDLKESQEDMKRWKRITKIDEERHRIEKDGERITLLHVTNPDEITRNNRYTIEALLRQEI